MRDKIEELKAKFAFWYIKKFVRLDKEFTFLLDLSYSNRITVKLLKKFPDTIVEYSGININDGLLNFEFDVIANPKLHDTKSKKFQRFTSNVMRSILIGAIENSTKVTNENGNADPIEFDTEREIHEEESPLPQKRVSKRKPRKKTV